MMRRAEAILAGILAALTMALAVIVIAALVSGCASGRAQVTAQGALLGLAGGLDAADVITSRLATAAVPDALEAVVVSCQEDGGCSPASARLRLRLHLSAWYDVADALELARATLLAMQAAAEIWYATDVLPATWGPLCAALGDATRAALGVLEAADVDAPNELRLAPLAVEAVCRYAERWR